MSLSDFGTIGAPGWFEAWTFILDVGTDYTGAGSNGNVSDIVHISANGAEMWSQTFDASLGGNGAFGTTFGAVLSTALGLSAAGTVQVVGDPLVGGARRFTNGSGGEIGLVNENLAGLAHLLDLTSPGIGAGSGDSLDVQSTADQINGPSVPEPATLTLMGIGGAVAAIRRRRKTV